MSSLRDGRSSSASSHSGRGDGAGGGSGSGPNRTSSIRTPKRQRPTPAATVDEKQPDLACPVCMNLIEEAHITRCGHTFCHTCITRSIDTLRSCPRCNAPLAVDQIFPNFLLNELVAKYRLRRNGLEALGGSGGSGGGGDLELATSAADGGLRSFVASESGSLTLTDVNVMLEVLTQRKQLLEAESCAAQNKLLLEFLRHLRQKKTDERQQVARELALIEADIEEVEGKLKEVHSRCPTLEDVERTVASAATLDENVSAMRQEMVDLLGNISAAGTTTPTALMTAAGGVDGAQQAPKIEGKLSSLATRRRRMHAHFDDFVQCYFQSRSKDLYFPQEEATSTSHHRGLDEFREDLVKFSRYSSVQAIATIQFASDVFNNSTIVSSIEFDKDNEYLAIAGVTKRIKIFEYGTVVCDVVNIHYPCVEMVSNSKISSVSWNSYHKNTLASSDYEGTVTIWDVGGGQRTKTYHEHEKRCWSVDFSETDPRLFASGSDDARVKLYNLADEHSVATLEARANICCVKFNPRSSFHLAFGSADHCVHYYDLRNLKEALCLFKGHKKAVSYVKFLNGEHIVSASTDSQLRMWHVGAPYCLRSFLGHVNERNFVGLATDGDYIACGSENNALYVYYKGLTKKLFKYKFDAPRGILEEEEHREDDPNEFVSAVCWKPGSNVLLAANSQGMINILELVGGALEEGKTRTFWDLTDNYGAVAVVGLGKKDKGYNALEKMCEDRECARTAAAVGCRALENVGVYCICVEDFEHPECAAEGAHLGTFKFQENRTKKKPVVSVDYYAVRGDSALEKLWTNGCVKASAQNLVRGLMDTPSNKLTPTMFAQRVEELFADKESVRVVVHDRAWMEKQKMGALLAVGAGSHEPPRFVELTYAASDAAKPPFVLVGKGVTFDSGGISIKPSARMADMRFDMGGAACVVGALYAAANLQLPGAITCLLPLTENMPGGGALRPGDVVTAANGRTIGVDNTDAEGRLLLADALSYAACLQPRPAWILDVATLTGAIHVALGNAAVGVFTNCDQLYELLEKASARSGDRVWRMPLWKAYTKMVTEFAAYDLNNAVGGGGGACTAAAFLQEFVPKDMRWLHLDIAGCQTPPQPQQYLRVSMAGRPTRTLIEFLCMHCQK